MCLVGEDGDVIQARTSWTKARLDVREGEAVGILQAQAIQWALGLGLQQVTIELDVKVVVDSIHPNSCDFSEFGSIISSVSVF